MSKNAMAGAVALVGSLVAGFVVGACANSANAALVQWSVANGGNGHWYGLSASANTWGLAEAEAVAAGGHLASIANAAENDFVFSLIAPAAGTSPGCWIGLSRSSSTDWSWSDGSAFDYTHWEPGEPNNAGGSEFWVGMYYSGSTWNDFHAGWGQQFGVIEVVPAPSAIAFFALAGLRARRRR